MDGLPATPITSSVISLSLPQKDQGLGNVASVPDSKRKKKICCACPDTKKLRDECIVEHGEAACEKWIQAHVNAFELKASMFDIVNDSELKGVSYDVSKTQVLYRVIR